MNCFNLNYLFLYSFRVKRNDIIKLIVLGLCAVLFEVGLSSLAFAHPPCSICKSEIKEEEKAIKCYVGCQTHLNCISEEKEMALHKKWSWKCRNLEEWEWHTTPASEIEKASHYLQLKKINKYLAAVSEAGVDPGPECYIHDLELLLDFSQLPEDGKKFVMSLLHDQRFLNAPNMSALPFQLRKTLIRRYVPVFDWLKKDNSSFLLAFSSDRVGSLVKREIAHQSGKKLQAEDKLKYNELSLAKQWYNRVFKGKNAPNYPTEKHKAESNSKPAYKNLLAFRKRQSRDLFGSFLKNGNKGTEEIQEKIIAIHGGTLLFLSDFIFGKTQGIQFHPLDEADKNPGFGIWVSPTNNEEAARASWYAHRSYENYLDYPVILKFKVAEKDLDAVPNKYEAGLSASNLDKISDISLNLLDSSVNIQASDIPKFREKLTQLLEELDKP